MKVWVHKKVLLQHIKSLPFKAWVKTFNQWVPGELQCSPSYYPVPSALIYFSPFPGWGRTSADVPLEAIHVDASVSKGLIHGGLPLTQFTAIEEMLRKMKVGDEQ